MFSVPATALLVAAFAAGLFADRASAQRHGAPIQQLNLDKARVALGGYDPVAYFRVGGGRAKEGKKALRTTLRGVIYQFSSERNRELFERDPERFEPDYGGWCAWAMASNDKVEVDPESFLIEDGRLLVFYDGFFNDTRSSWLDKGGKKLRPKADKNWDRFVGRKQAANKMRRAAAPKLALEGLDPTTTKSKDGGKPGSEKVVARIGDRLFRFVSKASRRTFLKNPEAYLPTSDSRRAIRGERFQSGGEPRRRR